MMVNILYPITDRPVLSFLVEPDFGVCFALFEEWFRITPELLASTITDIDLEPAALVDVEEAFIRAGLL